MRISDWSSDVCSSDLDQGAPIDLVGKRGGRTPIFRAVENRRNAQFDLLVEAGADIRRTDSMGNSLLHVAAQVNDADRILQLVEIGADPSATNSRRSEEHTSELQSLMRISYAVSCSKKKSTTQTK